MQSPGDRVDDLAGLDEEQIGGANATLCPISCAGLRLRLSQSRRESIREGAVHLFALALRPRRW
jgi:hypothetical protein